VAGKLSFTAAIGNGGFVSVYVIRRRITMGTKRQVVTTRFCRALSVLSFVWWSQTGRQIEGDPGMMNTINRKAGRPWQRVPRAKPRIGLDGWPID